MAWRTIPNRTTQRLRELPRAKVYVSQTWPIDGVWNYIPDLIAEKAVLTVGGTIGSADMRQHSGRMIRSAYGETTQQVIVPRDLVGQYVKIDGLPADYTAANAAARKALINLKIGDLVYQTDTAAIHRFIGPVGNESLDAAWELEPRVLWYGMITTETTSHYPAEEYPTNDRRFTAHAVDILLTRKQITSSTIWGDPTPITIQRGVPFNALRGDRTSRIEYDFANRSPDLIPSDVVYGFAASMNGAKNWTSWEIINYLNELHSPVDVLLGPAIIVDANAEQWLKHLEPVNVATHGRTWWDIANTVVDRHRGILWYLDAEEYRSGGQTLDKVTFRVAPYTEVAVTLPTGENWPANPVNFTVDISGMADLASCVHVKDSLREFAQITVEGGRAGSVFTVAVSEATIYPDWSQQQYESYLVPGTQDPQLDATDRKTLNDSTRASDLLRDVFCRFRVPEVWDGTVDVLGQPKPVFPLITGDGNINTNDGAPFWRAGLRFEHYLPLKTNVDYSTGSSQPPTVGPPETQQDFRPPLAVFQTIDSVGTRKWHYADDASIQAADELHPAKNIHLSCSLQVHDHQAGITLRPGGLSHTIQDIYTFDGQGGNPAESHQERGYVDQQTIGATVYAKSDQMVIAKYPPDAEVISPGNGSPSVHTISLGDRATVDYMLQGTVVDVRDGALVRTPGPHFIRDDRDRMKRLARFAWEWYKRPRNAVQLSINDITGQIRRGELLHSVVTSKPIKLRARDGTPVIGRNGRFVVTRGSLSFFNAFSVVSQIEWDFERGSTTITTDFAEMDFERVF